MYRYPPLLLLTPSLPYLAGQLIRSKLFAHSSGTTAVNISDVRMRPVALVVNLLSFSLLVIPIAAEISSNTGEILNCDIIFI